MKRFLIRILICLTCFVLSYPLIIIVSEVPSVDELSKNFIGLKTGGNGHLWTRLREADTTRNIDVLILGSSLAYRGIDTRSFNSLNLRAFNLGSSSQTPLQTQFLLEKYLDRLNPKYIIWDINPLSFVNSGLESFTDLFSNCSNCEGMENMVLKLNKIESYNFYLKKLILSSENKNFLESKIKNNDKYIQGGYVEYKSNEFNFKENKSIILDFINYQMSSFENSLFLLKRRNIPVLLVYAPVTVDFYMKIENKELYKNYFNRKKESGLVFDFIDFNDYLKLPNKFFFDTIHLNMNGVRIYNERLISMTSDFLFDKKSD